MDSLSKKAALSKLFLSPSGKGSTLKGKNFFLPVGANSFLLESTPFQKGDSAEESKLEVIKVFPLVQNGLKFFLNFHETLYRH